MGRDDADQGWPKQFTASAARDFLNEKPRPWAELKGRDLGQFRPPVATGIGQGGSPGDDPAVSGEPARNEDGEVTPWLPELAYWAFAPPPRLERWRLTLAPGGERAMEEPVANLIASAAWVARRQRVLGRLLQSGDDRLIEMVQGLQETLNGLAADSPELLTEPAYAAALVAASQLAPLVAIRTPSPSLEHRVRMDDVPTRLAWSMLTHGGLSTRLATVTVVALGLEGNQEAWSSSSSSSSSSSYAGLRERLRKMHRRDEYLPAAIAYLRGARFAPGPLEALALFRTYGRREAPDTVGLKKCFVVDLAMSHLGRERGKLPQELAVIAEVLSSSEAPVPIGSANSVPLAEVAKLVDGVYADHQVRSLSTAEIGDGALGGVPCAAVAWILRSRASLRGREVPGGVALVLEVAELFGEGVALDFLSRALSTLGAPSSA